jgi:hypothetical protein
MSNSRRKAHAVNVHRTDATDDSELLRRLMSPHTPAPEFGELLRSMDLGPCPADFAALLREQGSSQRRLSDVAARLLDESPTVPVLAFAAAVARDAGDDAEADRLLDLAFASAGSRACVGLMSILPGHGRLGDALRMLARHLDTDPDDTDAVRHYGAALRLAAAEPRGTDPRLDSLLDSFADRGAVISLRRAVDGWLRGPGARYQAVIDRLTDGWLRLVAGEPGWDARPVALLGELAAEFGLIMQPDDIPEGTDDNALLAFAADPGTPPELAARARDWRASIRYGLWRVDEPPGPGPGLVCTDVLSGRARYVEFPPEVRGDLVRWAVWYGGVVPVGGIWRATGPGARLSPAEADAAAELILAGAAASTTDGVTPAAASSVTQPQRALAQAQQALREAMKFGAAQPHGVAVDFEPSFPEHVALTVSRMAGAAIARVLGEIYRYRVPSPAPSNSSDEPACLIAATLAVTDPAELRAALLRRDDFGAFPGDPDLVGWLESAPPGAPGVALGTLRFSPARPAEPSGTVLAQVNSTARFASLLALLRKLDPGLTVSHEKRVDPVLHTAWPQAMHGTRSVSADGWERYWIDTSLAVLGHQTPRRAAGTRYLPELMTLLRQFEYQAGVLALEGKSGLDVDFVRGELGLAQDAPPPVRGIAAQRADCDSHGGAFGIMGVNL